jgi:hypothetical protein
MGSFQNSPLSKSNNRTANHDAFVKEELMDAVVLRNENYEIH